jgi:hypothetical protein
MLRRRFGTLSGAVVMAVAAATGLGGSVVSADGTCSASSGCVLAELGGGPVGAGTSQSVGGAASPLSLTLTDNTSQSLESATLTPPAGFTITATPVPNDGDSDNPPGSPPELAVVDNVLELSDLDIDPGETFTVPLSAQLAATASCAATPAVWSLVAYADDDWDGAVLTNDSSSALSVGVTGACSLTFAAGPTNAVAGADITSSIFNPSGAPVTVEALDANLSPIPGIPVTLAAELGSGTLSGGTPPSTTGAPSGLAPFAPLTISQTGYYELEASTTSPGFSPVSSSEFQITSTATACTSNCSGSADSNAVSVSVSVSGESGDYLSVALGGFAYSCPDRFSPTGYYRTVTGTVGVDLWQSNGSLASQGSELVTLTIPEPSYPADHWFFWPPFLPLYQVCYASTQPFRTLFGAITPASTTQTIPGYAGSTYIGLLPLCPLFHRSPSDAPCVVSQYWQRGGVVITFLGAPGDFWGSA